MYVCAVTDTPRKLQNVDSSNLSSLWANSEVYENCTFFSDFRALWGVESECEERVRIYVNI